MRYTVVLHKRAVKFLAGLTDRALYQKLRTAIDGPADDPHPAQSKRVTGRADYRLRVGDYCLLYTVDDGQLTILVINIGHRRDIYQ